MLPAAALPPLLSNQLAVEPGLQVGVAAPESCIFEAILASTTELNVKPLTCLQELMGETAAVASPAGLLPDTGKELPEPAIAADPVPDAGAMLALLPVPMVRLDPAAPLQSTIDAPPLKAASPFPVAALRPVPGLTPAKARPDQPALVTAPEPALAGLLQPVQAKPQVPGQIQVPVQTQAQVQVQAPGQAPVQAPEFVSSPALAAITPIAAAALPSFPLMRIMPGKEAPPIITAPSPLLSQVSTESPAPKPPIEATLGLSHNLSQIPPAALVTFTNPAPDAPFTAPAAVPAPQDFALLIDRLAAARESTQPQAATLAVAHADFGPVELRFTNDSKGLSVTMASSDPDFARAVQSAVPPVSASAESAATQARPQGQGNSQQAPSNGQSHGQPGHSGTSHGAQQERLTTRNRGGNSSDGPDSQQGIFA